MQFKGVTSKSASSAWVQRSLACACPVTGYIDHEIHWCVQFFFNFSAFFFSTSGSSLFSSTPRRFLFVFFCPFLRRFGPHASQYDEQHRAFVGPARSHVVHERWIRPLYYIKFHFFVLLYFVALFGLHLSEGSVTSHFSSFSAVAPSYIGGFSRERGAKFFQQYM